MSAPQTARPAKESAAPKRTPPAGHNGTLNGQCIPDTQTSSAIEGQDSPQAIRDSSPMTLPPAGTQAAQPAMPLATPTRRSLAGLEAGRDQTRNGTHGTCIPAAFIPGAQLTSDIQNARGTGEQRPPAATVKAAPKLPSPLADPVFMFTARVLSDVEQIRIATSNRVKRFEKKTADKDGKHRDSGITAEVRAMALAREMVSGEIDVPGIVGHLEMTVKTLKEDEHRAELYLCRLMRHHPLEPWRKTRPGIGPKLLARLLGEIGDPYMRPAIKRKDGTVEPARPRLISELTAYAGHGDPGRKRERGMTQAQLFACGNPRAKTRAYLVAQSCVIFDGKPDKRGKARALSPYRAVYDLAVVKHADAIHGKVCERCGPKGKPAQPGSPLSNGHKHQRATREVAREILKDLWREAKRLHEQAPLNGQSVGDYQKRPAVEGNQARHGAQEDAA